MASIDPSLIPDPNDQKWVVEMSKIVNQQLEIDVETPSVSLYRVPQTITTSKPEAYEPQQIGLGPIHHFQPRPYKKMQQKKLAVVRKILRDNEIKDYKLTVLNNVKTLVPIVRSCYDMFLQDDDEHLTWVLAIDGLFLLNVLWTYDRLEPHEVGPRKRSVARDVIMVENQIPFMILKQIDDALHSSYPDDHLSPSIYRNFCKIHSPLKLCSEAQAPSTVDHLLHYMYYAIVNKVAEKEPDDHDQVDVESHKWEIDCFSFRLYNARMGLYTFATNIPHDEIVHAYEQTISILEAFCECKRVIPSASDLHNAGFRFHRLEQDQGIRNIRARGKDVYLPVLTLNKDSDVILRNLVAYETLTSCSNSFPLTELMVLMCALVVSANDVKRLMSVIEGELGADEVAKLFTGMSGCIPNVQMTHESNLQRTIDEINRVYNSRMRMKLYMMLKKLAEWLLVVLRAIGGFVGSSWKIVAFIVSIVTVVFLTVQAYCDAYGCDDKSSTVQSVKVI